MIEKIEITGRQADITEDMKKYASRKIGKLDRYVAKHARTSLRAEIKLRENKSKDRKIFTATVLLHMPHEVVEASESTINMFAAIDIVEEKLKYQLRKYKEQHGDAKMRRTLFARFRNKNPTVG